jgi:endoplasmic reticulum Man9GlcNAc2 1,2-alpha-mannosidase
VLNTEAHPFPRFDMNRKKFKTGWERIPRDKNGELIRSKEVKREDDKPTESETKS